MADDPLSYEERQRLILAATHRGKTYDAAAALPDADLLLLAYMPVRRVNIFEEIPISEMRRRVRKVMDRFHP